MVLAAGTVTGRLVRVIDGASRIAGAVATLLLASAVLVVCQMIFIRYVLNGSTIWQTEFVIYAIVAATLIGSPYVLLHKGHVRVDLLPNALGGRWGPILDTIAGLLSMLFCALLGWAGWHFFYEALSRGWKTETVWAIPLWIPLLPLPLGIGLLCLQYVSEMLKQRGAPS